MTSDQNVKSPDHNSHVQAARDPEAIRCVPFRHPLTFHRPNLTSLNSRLRSQTEGATLRPNLVILRQEGQSPDRLPTSTGGHGEESFGACPARCIYCCFPRSDSSGPWHAAGGAGRAGSRGHAGSDHVHDESSTSSRNDRFAGRNVNFHRGSLHVPRNGSVAAGSRSCESVASSRHQCHATLADSAEAASGAVGDPQHAHPRCRMLCNWPCLIPSCFHGALRCSMPRPLRHRATLRPGKPGPSLRLPTRPRYPSNRRL